MRLQFRVSREKALEGLVFISAAEPGIDEMHIHKILYFAEKRHLNKYGRPIMADAYIRMDHGPVASLIRDIIHHNSSLEPSFLTIIDSAVECRRSDGAMRVTAKRDPNRDVFSKSDIDILRACIADYAQMPFNELSKLSKERPYLEAVHNRLMDYSLFIEDDNPVKEGIVRRAEEFASYGVF